MGMRNPVADPTSKLDLHSNSGLSFSPSKFRQRQPSRQPRSGTSRDNSGGSPKLTLGPPSPPRPVPTPTLDFEPQLAGRTRRLLPEANGCTARVDKLFTLELVRLCDRCSPGPAPIPLRKSDPPEELVPVPPIPNSSRVLRFVAGLTVLLRMDCAVLDRDDSLPAPPP